MVPLNLLHSFPKNSLIYNPGSYPTPPSALSLDAFVVLVNLVYAFPSLIASSSSSSSSKDCADDDPLLPIGGVLDHCLLRLTAALQLTQNLLLLREDEDVEKDRSPTLMNEWSEPMEVDREGEMTSEGEKEKRDLVECWRKMRTEAGFRTMVSSLSYLPFFMLSSIHSYYRIERIFG